LSATFSQGAQGGLFKFNSCSAVQSRLNYDFRAVAENQPGKNKNRMNATHSICTPLRPGTGALRAFSSRLRDFFGESLASAEPRREEFSRLGLELFALQFELNKPYRKICQARGVSPHSVTQWEEIPAVPTSAFKDLEFSCVPAAERSAVFHSSGTTGQRPSRHFHHGLSLEVYEASLLPWFFKHVLGMEPEQGQGSRGALQLMILTPAPVLAPHSSLVYMFETVRRTLSAPESVYLGELSRDGLWSVDFTRTIAALERAVDANQPVLLLGTAFSFIHLLDFLAEQSLRIRLPLGSRAMETGGYKGKSRALAKTDLHLLITERLGIPNTGIVSEYGMSELSSQAYAGCASTIRTPLTRGGERESPAECGGANVRPSRALSKQGQSGAVPPLPNPLLQRRRGNSAKAFCSGQFLFPGWCGVQITSPENGREVGEGQTGLIRVFDLANVYSVLAVQTEDLGIRRGSGFELLGRAARVEARGCSLLAV